MDEITWFVAPKATVHLTASHPWTRPAIPALPQLSALLAQAEVTPFTVDGQAYELLAWGPAQDRRGWLCLPPGRGDTGLHPVHQHFLAACGGVIERFNEPESWLLNQHSVLTVAAAHTDIAAVLHDYKWLWQDAGLDVPVSAQDYYAVAVEANGNLTLAHRISGQLLLFAPDHSFSGVTPLAGCPEYSLYVLDAAADLPAWVELCAAQWLRAIAP